MKRRYTGGSSPRHYNTADNGFSLPARVDPLSADVGRVQAQQQLPLQTHYALQPGEQSPDELSEPGLDPIEGRVLKRMKRIKLDSDSPPIDAYVPYAPPIFKIDDMTRILHHDDQPQQRDTSQDQQYSSETIRKFGPIKISTRSGETAESTDSFQSVKTAQDRQDTALYSGMNTILYQVHAARFGIPEQVLLEAEASSADSDATNQPQSHTQQQQETRQRQQQDQLNVQQNFFGTHTAWHQAQRNLQTTARPVDEDDEMQDVEDSGGIGSSYSAVSFNAMQREQQGLDSRQRFALDQQQQQQYQLQSDQADHQNPQAHSGPTCNEYQDINAQLRAAFFARMELEKSRR
ncbi:hypothetical protein BGZ98_009732 [Dissophora globulifera]|nr:hypothetical protein BGZ98_009732 [Dissophora globulifera]